jgi:hypothetical protein
VCLHSELQWGNMLARNSTSLPNAPLGCISCATCVTSNQSPASFKSLILGQVAPVASVAPLFRAHTCARNIFIFSLPSFFIFLSRVYTEKLTQLTQLAQPRAYTYLLSIIYRLHHFSLREVLVMQLAQPVSHSYSFYCYFLIIDNKNNKIECIRRKQAKARTSLRLAFLVLPCGWISHCPPENTPPFPKGKGEG